VLYKGIDNPASVSVLGTPSENLQVSISGGNQIRKESNGNYVVSMSTSSPYDVKISVSATLSDGSGRNMWAMSYRAKNLPAPYASI